MRGSRTIRTRAGNAFGPPRFGCYNASGRGRRIGMIEGANRWALLRRGWRVAACALAAAAALAGCSSTPTPSPTATAGASASVVPPPASSSSPSFTSRVKSLFSGDSATLATPQTAAATQIDCPPVEQRLGAATYAVNAPGSEGSALAVRYQASFTQTARECIVRGSEVAIKVGVEGRVIVGPAGGPGQVDIPVRYALVREGLTPKVIWTKLYVQPVPVPDGQFNVPFIHVEEDMVVPIPPTAELEAYVIYVGFDPDGIQPAKPAPKPRAARKPAAPAKTN